MFSKFATRAIKATTVRVTFDKFAARTFAVQAVPATADHSAAHPPAHAKVEHHLDIVEPELYDSLEWVLTSPPPIHQFEEPPIVVEIEHLDNLHIPEDL